MNVEQQRRSFLSTMGLFTLGSLGLSQMAPQALASTDAPGPQGYVLPPDGGEHLIHFRDGGNVFIKIGKATGSENLALGTQQIMKGTGIPVHRHLKMDEAFLVLEGGGTAILNDVRHDFEKGGTIFIPRNTWHAFENPDHEVHLLWVVTPAGLDSFFRDTCSPPGAPPKGLTREQIREIALKKYDTEFR